MGWKISEGTHEMGKVKTILLSIGGGILAALLFILGRGSKASGALKGRADRNRDDLGQQLDGDRERNDQSGEDLERQRALNESERDRLERERNLNQQGKDSTGRTRSIIHNARTAIRGILGNSSGDGKG